MDQFRDYIYLLSLSLLMFSCGTVQVDQTTPISALRSLNINFHENIISTNPFEAQSSSEKFVTDLVYERLYNTDGTSNIINNCTYDSLQSRYLFKMYTGRKFHDGSLLDTRAIRSLLKYLFQNRFIETDVQILYNSIKGSEITNWYRENRNILDSIPRGFEILNDSVFSIALKNKNYNLIEGLRSNEFTIFKNLENKFIGSGDYKLSSLNEDISAQLVKIENSPNKLEVINISFIKNEEVVFNEFLSGALDLITYNRIKNPVMAKNEQLQKMIADKYPRFQVNRNNHAVMRYASLQNVYDSLILQNILASTIFKTDSPRYWLASNLMSIPTAHFADSLVRKIQVSTNQKLQGINYFNDGPGLTFVATNSENINPSEPHIVIMETDVEHSSSDLEIHSILESQMDSQMQGINTFIELEQFYTYVIYNNKLKGIEEYQTLSQVVSNMYYVVPNVY